MKCMFIPHDGDCAFRCERCGRLAFPRTHCEPKRIHAVCRVPGVGDWLAYYLAWLGVTKDRVRRVKGWLGLARQCGCQERQEKLNRWGHRLRQTFSRRPDA